MATRRPRTTPTTEGLGSDGLPGATPDVVDALTATFAAPTAEEMGRRHDGLVARAAEVGLLDVAYRSVDSPYGPLLVAATTKGLVRVAFAHEQPDRVLADLADRISPRILRSGRGTDDAARQLDEYFARRRQDFDLPLDLRLASGFRREVLVALCAIPYGTTRSYAGVARAVGRPKAMRAVGTACARNPIPLVVPCHRVVRSDGSVGNYGGGPETKVELLAMEAGVHPAR